MIRPREELAINSVFHRGSLLGLQTLLLLILTVSLLGFDARSDALKPVRSFISSCLSPFYYLVNAPTKSYAWANHRLSSQEQLVSENTDLKARLLLLESKLQKQLALEKENNQLRDLLRSSTELSTDKLQAAEIMAVATNPQTNEVIINKGSSHGIQLGQPVLDAHGIFGQVVSVEPKLSRVLLLNATRSAIAVENSRNNVRAVAAGRGLLGDLELLHIPQTTDIRQGDLLLSSGLDQRYPRGYPVGVVKEVVNETGESFVKVIVEPSAQLRRSRLVLLPGFDTETV